MPNEHKISLPAAILINTNITMGSGLFINTVVLSHVAGALSGLTYAIIGILLLPLILTFTQLLRRYPTGGFYAYGSKGINTFSGFFSSWTYFIGKLASASLAIHAAMSLLQAIFPLLRTIPIGILDGIIIGAFTLLNMLNLKEGSKVQIAFILTKTIPLFFVIITGLFFATGQNFTAPHLLWDGLPSSIPLALFSFFGFEAACAISNSIENPERNAHRAVFFSYITSVTITIAFQTLFYLVLGSSLATQASYLGAFPALIAHLGLSPEVGSILVTVMHIAIASSALGSAYGIIYSNAWTLHTLAQHKHVFFSNIIERFNKNRIPYWCILIEAAFVSSYLLITKGSQLPLQQIAVLCIAMTYTVAVISAIKTSLSEPLRHRIIPMISIVICAILVSMSILNFFRFGATPLFALLAIFAFGILMYAITPGKSIDTIENEPEEEISWEQYY